MPCAGCLHPRKALPTPSSIPQMRRILFSAPLLFLAAVSVVRSEPWQMHPDAVEQSSVPHGKVYKMEPWQSKIYSGTVRDWSVYIPAQLQTGQEAAVMVFQDGHDYLKPTGHWRAPVVFDNLIARGDMPPQSPFSWTQAATPPNRRRRARGKPLTAVWSMIVWATGMSVFCSRKFFRRLKSAGNCPKNRNYVRYAGRVLAGFARLRRLGSGPKVFKKCCPPLAASST